MLHRIFITVLFSSLLSIGCNKVPEPEDAFSGIPISDWDGGTKKISDFRGRVLVLDFWASWCAPCKKAVPVIEAAKKKTNPSIAIFYGVNTDSGKSISEIKLAGKGFEMTYPSFLDPKLILADAMQVEGQPAVFIFNKRGNIVYKQYGLIEKDYPVFLAKIIEAENQ
ncbi:MAG: TlpA family protein disulfide reductase [Leptospira sp.]|nr:TlpA family protein disulfide reductase [Leptospira sp.]